MKTSNNLTTLVIKFYAINVPHQTSLLQCLARYSSINLRHSKTMAQWQPPRTRPRVARSPNANGRWVVIVQYQDKLWARHSFQYNIRQNSNGAINFGLTFCSEGLQETSHHPPSHTLALTIEIRYHTGIPRQKIRTKLQILEVKLLANGKWLKSKEKKQNQDQDRHITISSHRTTGCKNGEHIHNVFQP